MRQISFVLVFSIYVIQALAQDKAPFVFRYQEKRTTSHIRHYLKHDTLIETSAAKIHVHYSNAVGKPYLLLLHGMGVDAKTNWYRQIKTLSKYYNLIAPDLIYFGTSTSKTEDYSVEFQAKQIHELISILGIKSPVHVMGFSYGGLTAAVYNQLFSDTRSKLILMDAPVKFYSSAMADSMAKVAGVDSMSQIIIPQSLKDFAALEKAVISKKFPLTKKMKRKFMAFYFTPTLATRKKQLNYLYEQEKKYQSYNYHLETTSTLLVWGKKDGVVPLSVAQSIVEAYPKTCQVKIFKKAKHDVHFRYAKQLNKTVLAFLAN